ncbi:MAG: RNA replicase beta chain [Sanya fiers-like virus 40]|nr:MAG: RNA replicase beta chain [Sanya fiers-like virus 40]
MHQVQSVLADICRKVATPRALSIYLLSSHGEWAQLQELKVDPLHYTDSESYWQDTVVTDLLRKCDLESGVDREQAAIDTFLACERQNASTNIRLSRYLPDTEGPLDPPDVAVLQFITEWRKEANAILGNLPLDLVPRFSGGATYGDTGSLITTPDKMSSVPTITHGARPLLPFWWQTAWARSNIAARPRRHVPRTVRGNIFFCVPKDGRTFRGCCKEPSINIGFQLDIGRFMKERLRKNAGIDLKSGQDLHRTLAREASVTGRLGTIDLSNASDTMCRNLVKLVLRSDWHDLLNSLRSSHTRLRGRWYRLEKFSSMGNGFTFELETLLFVSLARCIVRQRGGDPSEVKCYGDDLIVPVSDCTDVLAALKFFGFTPNRRKTFTSGPFRESCGGDFFSGVPVRGHFLEELPDEPQKWISLANGLRRCASAPGAPPSRWDLVRSAWRRCVRFIPSEIRRCRGPEHLGDVVLHDTPDTWSVWQRDTAPRPFHRCGGVGWDVVWVRAYTPVQGVLPWHHWHPSVQLASCTLSLSSRGVTPRDYITGYRFSWVVANLTSDWLPDA